MIRFSDPVWLWGLSGLLIPLGIHLLSRKEGKVIRFGSIRHLSESHTRRFKSIRLNEIMLLMMRCMLIILLVLLLAGAQLSSALQKKAQWLLIESGLVNDPLAKKLADSLLRSGYEVHLLAEGFPSTHNEAQDNNDLNYWNLVDDLNEQNLGHAIVLSYNLAARLKGNRIPLPKNIHWIPFSPPPDEFIAQAIRMSRDSLWIRKGYTSPDHTRYVYEQASLVAQNDKNKITEPDSINVLVLSAPDFEEDKKIIVAQLKAIQFITPHKIIVTTEHARSDIHWNEYDWAFALGEEVTATEGIKMLVYKDCKDKNLPLIVPATQLSSIAVATPSTYLLTRRLNTMVAVEHHLGVVLAKLLLPDTSQRQIALHDKRTFPEQLMWSSGNEHDPDVAAEKHTGMVLDEYLILLFLLTLITERVFSFRRNQ